MKENMPILPGEDRIKAASMEALVPLFQERLKAGQTVRFSPRGISMQPMLRHGLDVVELSPAPERLRKYDLPLYRRDDGKYILHRVVEVGETYSCIGDNQYALERGIRRDQIIALVTSFRRGSRAYSVSHPGYRIYCRLWHHSRSIRWFLRRAKGWLRRHLT